MRSPSIGLYHTIGKIEGLPYPEAVFDGSFFRSNPKPFYKLVSQIYPQRLEPTATHRFFTLLNQKVSKTVLSDFIVIRVKDYYNKEKYIKIILKICLFLTQKLLRRVYTQNIDALEFLSGLPEDKVVEAHGTFQRSYCTACKRSYDLPWVC